MIIRAILVHQLLPFLATSDGWEILSALRPTLQGYAIHISYNELTAGTQSADLVAALDMQPLEGLTCVSAAVHEVISPISPLLSYSVLFQVKSWSLLNPGT